MFDFIEENRYPWENAIDFWQGAYWAQIESLHLVLATFFIGYISYKTILKSNLQLEFRLAILYFSLTVFNNPAFNIVGLHPNEFFGVLALLVVVSKGRLLHGKKSSIAVIGVFFTFLITAIHALVIALVYPNLLPDLGTAFLKIAVIFKIFVLAGNLAIVGAEIKNENNLTIVISNCLLAGTFALLMYVVQIFVIANGALPYGTYLDAGFIGLPSFGSVSIERGHFGKFMAPYFPVFLYALVKWKAKFQFLLYCLIGIINFSASSQFFFLCALFLTGILFFQALNIRGLIGTLVMSTLMIIFLSLNWNVFEAIIDKVVSIAIQGDESQGGGRSFGLFVQYILSYPLGMGYSGSTLRTAPDLPEINAAYYAFIAQYSFISIPLIVGFFYILKRAIKINSNLLINRCFNVGVLMAPIIFFTDILWFVPLIWLSIEINLSVNRSTPVNFTH